MTDYYIDRVFEVREDEFLVDFTNQNANLIPFWSGGWGGVQGSDGVTFTFEPGRFILSNPDFSSDARPNWSKVNYQSLYSPSSGGISGNTFNVLRSGNFDYYDYVTQKTAIALDQTVSSSVSDNSIANIRGIRDTLAFFRQRVPDLYTPANEGRPEPSYLKPDIRFGVGAAGYTQSGGDYLSEPANSPGAWSSDTAGGGRGRWGLYSTAGLYESDGVQYYKGKALSTSNWDGTGALPKNYNNYADGTPLPYGVRREPSGVYAGSVGGGWRTQTTVLAQKDTRSWNGTGAMPSYNENSGGVVQNVNLAAFSPGDGSVYQYTGDASNLKYGAVDPVYNNVFTSGSGTQVSQRSLNLRDTFNVDSRDLTDVTRGSISDYTYKANPNRSNSLGYSLQYTRGSLDLVSNSNLRGSYSSGWISI